MSKSITTPPPPAGVNTPIMGPSEQDPVIQAWLKYCDAVKNLLRPNASDRFPDQYLQFRDEVFRLIQSNNFLQQFLSCWNASFSNNKTIGDLLLMEIKTFPLAVETSNSTEVKKKKKKRGILRSLLGRASTVAGSIEDLLDKLPPVVKGGITLFKELIDLFKG